MKRDLHPDHNTPLELFPAACTAVPLVFFQNEALTVAEALPGKVLLYKGKLGWVGGIITEVEAYHQHEPASHSFKGITNRNQPMFLNGGHIYIYFIYGMYYCLNIVTGAEGNGQAVLIRGLLPMYGRSAMMKNRFGKKQGSVKNIANGPGILFQALAITPQLNGKMLGSDLTIAQLNGSTFPKPLQSSRVGISKATELPWRFFLPEDVVHEMGHHAAS